MYESICSLAERLAGDGAPREVRQHLVRRAYGLLLDMDDVDRVRHRRGFHVRDGGGVPSAAPAACALAQSAVARARARTPSGDDSC